MVCHSSLSDNKSPQVSRTLLRILVDLIHAVVWMVSIRSLTFISSSPNINLLVTVPRVPITIGITVTFIVNSFTNSLGQGIYLSFRFLSILLCGLLRQQSPLFSLIITWSGYLAEIRWSITPRCWGIIFAKTENIASKYELFTSLKKILPLFINWL